MGRQVQESSTVAMVDSQFDPRNIHDHAGRAVTWTNEDSRDHTVTSASANWQVDELVAGGKSVAYTFEDSGVYDVYCSFHGFATDLDGMSMNVAVGDATIEDPVGSGKATTDDGGGAY
jgi:plastocyanin